MVYPVLKGVEENAPAPRLLRGGLGTTQFAVHAAGAMEFQARFRTFDGGDRPGEPTRPTAAVSYFVAFIVTRTSEACSVAPIL
jgi:hypothetical protein